MKRSSDHIGYNAKNNLEIIEVKILVNREEISLTLKKVTTTEDENILFNKDIPIFIKFNDYCVNLDNYDLRMLQSIQCTSYFSIFAGNNSIRWNKENSKKAKINLFHGEVTGLSSISIDNDILIIKGTEINFNNARIHLNGDVNFYEDKINRILMNNGTDLRVSGEVTSNGDFVINKNFDSSFKAYKLKYDNVLGISSKKELVTRLDLLRHAKSNWNGNMMGGEQDTALCDDGKKQATMFARKLLENKIEYDFIYTSDLKRCNETTTIITKIIEFDKSKIIIDKRLRERSFGTIENKNVSDMFKQDRRAYSTEEDIRSIESRLGENFPVDGEKIFNFESRVSDFLLSLIKRIEEEGIKVLVVTHSCWSYSALTILSGRKQKIDHSISFAKFDYATPVTVNMYKKFLDINEEDNYQIIQQFNDTPTISIPLSLQVEQNMDNSKRMKLKNKKITM